ncbi:MAG: response regulator, partial [candidate division Zixibacteria bacterium]|nr:response regulator [candidate division Zixibacteria bacterium]
MSDLSKMRIMVVDDVKANIDILLETLANDYKVSVAMDGESAIEDIKVNLPDLILLDIVMPDINGYEVCTRLKADPATENIPIIFVTSKSNEADERKGLELGAVDYITKPFSPSIVKARIRTHLSLIGVQQALAKQNELMKHSLSLAMEVQQNLIPQSAPKIDGFDIAGQIIYCDETGGDYFDYIEIKEDQQQKLCIAVGDVSEHGIPSALLMTTARALIRHRLTFPGALSTIISDVNHQFSEDVKESGRFMTLFFCC